MHVTLSDAALLMHTFTDITSCPSGEFLCQKYDHNVCISYKRRCDNTRDCIDGKDEEGCGE